MCWLHLRRGLEVNEQKERTEPCDMWRHEFEDNQESKLNSFTKLVTQNSLHSFLNTKMSSVISLYLQNASKLKKKNASTNNALSSDK